MCIVTVCFPICDVMNFKVKPSFLIKPSGQKLKVGLSPSNKNLYYLLH